MMDRLMETYPSHRESSARWRRDFRSHRYSWIQFMENYRRHEFMTLRELNYKSDTFQSLSKIRFFSRNKIHWQSIIHQQQQSDEVSAMPVRHYEIVTELDIIKSGMKVLLEVDTFLSSEIKSDSNSACHCKLRSSKNSARDSVSHSVCPKYKSPNWKVKVGVP